jgi:HK97 family phage prohead protease
MPWENIQDLPENIQSSINPLSSDQQEEFLLIVNTLLQKIEEGEIDITESEAIAIALAEAKKKSATITNLKALDNMIVEGYASATVKDRDGDILLARDVIAGIKKGNPSIRRMHQPVVVGTLKESRLENEKVYIQCQLDDTADGRDTYTQVQNGSLKAFSIGFGGVTSKSYIEELNATLLRNFEVGEISLVDHPANQEAIITAYKYNNPEEEKSMDKMKELETKVGQLNAKIQNLEKDKSKLEAQMSEMEEVKAALEEKVKSYEEEIWNDHIEDLKDSFSETLVEGEVEKFIKMIEDNPESEEVVVEIVESIKQRDVKTSPKSHLLAEDPEENVKRSEKLAKKLTKKFIGDK